MASADVVSPAGPGGRPVVHGFDPMNPGQIDDPGPLTAIARREAPVFFAPAFDCYVVTRHADVARIMSDMRLFRGLSLTELEVPERAAHVLPQGFLGRRAGMLAWNDPDEHSRIRKLAQRAFTRKAALANEPRIRELFDATVDEFIADGEADLLPVFARRCPMRVMTAILGIDPAVEDRLHTWTRDTMRLMGDPTLDEAAVVDLAHRQSDFERFVTDLIAERRAAPRPEGDLISDLLRSQDDEGGRGLDDEEIFATIALSIVAGGDTSVNLIGQLVARMLADGGDLWRSIDADRSRLDLVIEEELRHSHVGRLAFRRPAEDVEVGGVAIPAGSLIALHFWSTGRDDDVFEDPDRFDPDRGNIERHLGFGLHGGAAGPAGDALPAGAAPEPSARARTPRATGDLNRHPEPARRARRRVGCSPGELSMSQILPPGVTPERFAAALAGFAAIVGDEHVQTSDEVLAAHQDEFHIGDPGRHTPSAVVRPDGVDEVRAIVRLASELRGYGEYRAHVDFMDLIAEQYDFNDGAMSRFNARIKGALDPQGILSPGKQGIWPAEAPWSPSSNGSPAPKGVLER